MAILHVATLPAFPFAFFSITNRVFSVQTEYLYRPVYNTADLNALLLYLNTTYKINNFLMGLFSVDGERIVYTTGMSEVFFPNTFSSQILTKRWRVHIDSPQQVTHYIWTWGVVIAWGDGNYTGYQRLNPQEQTRYYPSHTYGATRSPWIDYFHADSFNVILFTSLPVTAFSGDQPTLFYTLAVRDSLFRTLDIMSLFHMCHESLILLEFYNCPQLVDVCSIGLPWKQLQTVDFRYCNLSREAVDRVFLGMYRSGMLNPDLQKLPVKIWLQQNKGAVPTVASLECRKVMSSQWNWTLTHD